MSTHATSYHQPASSPAQGKGGSPDKRTLQGTAQDTEEKEERG